jgi:dihydropteroate synthase
MEFRWGERTYIMGVVNLTPDSFSGDGLAADAEGALSRAKEMARAGADVIDVGGESTRPGASPVPLEEELRRVLPALERLAREIILPISIDTYKAEVARQVVRAGAALINDVWGLKQDPDLATVAAEAGVPLILMHNQRGASYRDLIPDMMASLRASIENALAAGVSRENIIIDPGIGFGKTVAQNLEVLRHLGEFRGLGRPMLLGTSRKLAVAPRLPPGERWGETAATVALAVASGADMVRVHDVSQMVRVARMADVLVRGRQLEEVTAYLGLGSNLGDREANIARAVDFLSQRLTVDRLSSLYETEPVGYRDQPRFLNAVCQVSTVLSPGELLALAKAIEGRLGRVTSFPNAPRPLDIDILLYGDRIVDSLELRIPHPRLTERAFVLVPLAELAPDLVHPETGRRIGELLVEVEGREGVRLWGGG